MGLLEPLPALALCALKTLERFVPGVWSEGILGFFGPMRRNLFLRSREIPRGHAHVLRRLVDRGLELASLLLKSVSRQGAATLIPRVLKRGAAFVIQPESRIRLDFSQLLTNFGKELLERRGGELRTHRWLELT